MDIFAVARRLQEATLETSSWQKVYRSYNTMRGPTTTSRQAQVKNQGQEYQPSIGLVALKTSQLQQKKAADTMVTELQMRKRPPTAAGGTFPQRMGLL